MRALLVRVGADQTESGGYWNGPFNSITREFAYVPIPETKMLRPGFRKPFGLLEGALERFGKVLPPAVQNMNMHLDPDFAHLTYGDQGERAKQIRSKLGNNDLLVFYAALADMNPARRLTYAIIGLYVIHRILDATAVPRSQWEDNAHTRRVLKEGATDIVVRAKPEKSGRLERCIPIGEFRDRAYRLTQPLLRRWGGISAKNGFLQRSVRLPEILNAAAFYSWFRKQHPTLLNSNN
jgi:putative DNA base modification enzyme with NMAD domain